MTKELKTPTLIYTANTFCPGCGHGIISKLLALVLEELGIENKSTGAVAVGCACLLPESFGCDWIQAQHGRAPAVAAGIKRVRPNNFVFTCQGDGDAGAIGIAESIYAAKRNEGITTIFVNNGVFGMTGGQCAPTTLEGQKTTTTQAGCDYRYNGKPLELAELLASFDVGYVARGSVCNFKELWKTKEYIKEAVQCQLEGRGYSFVEVLAPCPTNWKMTPVESMKRIEDIGMKYFRCGVLKGGAE